MKTAEYVGKVLSDGHLSLPEFIIEQLGLEVNSDVRVLLIKESWEESYDRIMAGIRAKVPEFSEEEVRKDVEQAIVEARGESRS